MGDLNKIRQKFIIPYLLLGIVNLIVNSFLIHALRRLDKLRTISYKLILCLTISDLFTGIELIVEEIMNIAFIRDESSIWRLAFLGVGFLLAQFSCLTTLAIAVDRYIHMKYLHKYSVVITNRKAILFCILNVLLSLIYGALLPLGMIYRFFFVSRLILFANASAIYAALLKIYLNAYQALFRRTKQLNLSRGTRIEASEDPGRHREVAVTEDYKRLPNIETFETLCKQRKVETSGNLSEGPQTETIELHGRQPKLPDHENLGRQPQINTASKRKRESTHRGKTKIDPGQRTRSVSISKSTTTYRNPSKEFAKAVMCVLISILIFYLPYFVATLLRAYNDERKKIMKPELALEIWLCTIVFSRLHSCVNATILIIFDRQLRRYTRTFFRKKTTQTNHPTSSKTLCNLQSTR